MPVDPPHTESRVPPNLNSSRHGVRIGNDWTRQGVRVVGTEEWTLARIICTLVGLVGSDGTNELTATNLNGTMIPEHFRSTSCANKFLVSTRVKPWLAQVGCTPLPNLRSFPIMRRGGDINGVIN